MVMEQGTITLIGFGIGLAIGAFVVFMILYKLMGTEGWAFAHAHMGLNKKKQGRFFMIVESNNRAHFEYVTKDSPDNPYYELDNGVLAADPSQHDSDAPLRFSKGLECYQCSPQTPQLISVKEVMFLKRMVMACRQAHPELEGVLSDMELVSLITTERDELWHDCERFCSKEMLDTGAADNEGVIDDDFNEDSPNETADYIWSLLDGKDRDYQNIVMSTIYRNMKVIKE